MAEPKDRETSVVPASARTSNLPLDLEHISGTHRLPSDVPASSIRHKVFGPISCGWGAGDFFHLTVRGGMINREQAGELVKELQAFLRSKQ